MKPVSRAGRRLRLLLTFGLFVAVLLAAAGLALDRLDRIGYFGMPAERVLRPAAPPRDGLGILILSGDMGLNVGLSPAVATRMAGAGYPVIAVNSLASAADGRTPAELAGLIARDMRRLLAMPGVTRVVLIGHSFGADLMHVGLAGLSRADRDKVAIVILEVPTDSIYLTAGFREYFELGKPDLEPLASAARLTWVPVTCIRGAEERTSLCPMLRMANVRHVILPGGHELDHDGARLFAASLDAVRHHRR